VLVISWKPTGRRCKGADGTSSSKTTAAGLSSLPEVAN